MSSDRRTLLRGTALGVTAAIAGCLGRNGPSDGNGDSDDPTPAVDSSETLPLATHTTRPWWTDENEIGRAVLIDSDERQRATFGEFDLPEPQREKVRTFLSGIDYTIERVLVVESVGPNACYDRIEIDSVRIENGDIRANATVSESGDASMGCAEVITFSSAVVRIAFDGAPLDAAAVELTNGWNETATVRAETGEPIS